MTLIKRSPGVYLPSISGMLDDIFTNDLFDWNLKNFSMTNTTLPAVNIKEEDNKFIVEMAAPGLKKDDLKINIEGQMLRISSEKSAEVKEEDEDKKYMRREFSYQSFIRTFNLPKTVDPDKIEAKYKDGILFLEIPKKEEAKVKPVKEIKIG
jgi:HSP20 family protein